MSQSRLIALVLVLGTLLVHMPAAHHELATGLRTTAAASPKIRR